MNYPKKQFQAHHQIILDSIADGVFTVDKEMNITSFNRAAEGITGFSRKDAIGFAPVMTYCGLTFARRAACCGRRSIRNSL